MDIRDSQNLVIQRTARFTLDTLAARSGQSNSDVARAATETGQFIETPIDPTTGEPSETDYFRAGDPVGSKPVRNSRR